MMDKLFAGHWESYFLYSTKLHLWKPCQLIPGNPLCMKNL